LEDVVPGGAGGGPADESGKTRAQLGRSDRLEEEVVPAVQLAHQVERRVLVGQDQHGQELAPFFQGLQQAPGVASCRAAVEDARIVAVPRKVVQEGPCASEEMAASAAFQEDVRHTAAGGLVLSDDRDSHPWLYSGGPKVHLTAGYRGRQGPGPSLDPS